MTDEVQEKHCNAENFSSFDHWDLHNIKDKHETFVFHQQQTSGHLISWKLWRQVQNIKVKSLKFCNQNIEKQNSIYFTPPLLSIQLFYRLFYQCRLNVSKNALFMIFWFITSSTTIFLSSGLSFWADSVESLESDISLFQLLEVKIAENVNQIFWLIEKDFFWATYMKSSSIYSFEEFFNFYHLIMTRSGNGWLK